jgi:hypothetical protein
VRSTRPLNITDRHSGAANADPSAPMLCVHDAASKLARLALVCAYAFPWQQHSGADLHRSRQRHLTLSDG